MVLETHISECNRWQLERSGKATACYVLLQMLLPAPLLNPAMQLPAAARHLPHLCWLGVLLCGLLRECC